MFYSSVICANEIQQLEQNGDGYYVQCSECGTMQDHTPSFTKGNPCNIALIGHWDGWQPFGYPGSHILYTNKNAKCCFLLVQASLPSVLQLCIIR